jgi:tetratricopeptide (TPR) repeat protein
MSAEHKKKEETVIPLDIYIKKITNFYEEKKKTINVASSVCLVVLALALAYFLYWVPKKQQEAAVAIFKAERYVGMDSLQLALDGDGVNSGLLSVIDEYGYTKDGNRAKYMAGICYLKLGQYDEAISYLKKFRSRNKLVSVQALGSIGDAYMEKNDMDNAVKYYKKAVSKNPNELVTPIYLQRLGWAYDMQGKWGEALACFETLRQEYSQLPEAMDAEKRIAFLKGKMGK